LVCLRDVCFPFFEIAAWIDKNVLKMQYIIELQVERVHKGEIDEDKPLYAHYWRTYKVPAGFSGDRGQVNKHLFSNFIIVIIIYVFCV
jgi:hypothetical protein